MFCRCQDLSLGWLEAQGTLSTVFEYLIFDDLQHKVNKILLGINVSLKRK